MSKRKYLIEILLVFSFLWLKGLLINNFPFRFDDNVIVVVSYAIDILLILFIVINIEKKFISSIGIKSISFWDIFSGFVLGVVLYLVQILPPIIFMNMDISQFVEAPRWMPLFFRFLFLVVTVGLGEELVFRGFLLQRLEWVFKYKLIAVFLNCFIFYIFHLTKAFVFVWTQVYSTFATTIIFCVYLYGSKKKSIFPVVIAHGMLDVLLGAPGFYFLNLVLR